MPSIHVNGAWLHYEESGSGPETVVFAHGLLWSGRMFDAQVAALRDRYRCITYDLRGQGQSEVTADGYDMDTLAEDAAALIEALGAAPCHFVGLSMGGFIGMRLAFRRPRLLRSLVLMETSPYPEPPESARKYRMLGRIARWISLRLVADRVMKIMFGWTFLNDPGREEERREWRARLLANHPVGIQRALRGVTDREGVDPELTRIHTPTLVVVGTEDVATPREKAERIATRIPGARLVVIPCAGHTSSVEEPEAVSQALLDFIPSHGPSAAVAPAEPSVSG
ncbi:MAG TPA: alpha/beta fold hydrolase [Longimicrobium sp.]|nr:alpha/beta fold hydrolase [Longimicrobium sp.]